MSGSISLYKVSYKTWDGDWLRSSMGSMNVLASNQGEAAVKVRNAGDSQVEIVDIEHIGTVDIE